MHAKVKEGDNEQETTRGASLRELTGFFKKYDEDKGYAGLRRIADEDGTAVWTILEESEVTTKLEERAEQRKQEERRRDDLFSAQARAPLGTTGAAWKEAEERLRAELKAEMIATAALKEREAPSDADPDAAIGGLNTGNSGGEYGGGEGGAGEGGAGEGGGPLQLPPNGPSSAENNGLQQVVVASNAQQLQQMQHQMSQMQKDMAALNKGPVAVTVNACKCSIL